MSSRTTLPGPFGISTGTPPAKGNVSLARQQGHGVPPRPQPHRSSKEAHLAGPASLALARSPAFFASCLARETLR